MTTPSSPPPAPSPATTSAPTLDERALESAASVFSSYQPNNNRATTDADRQGARNIVTTYLDAVAWWAAKERT